MRKPIYFDVDGELPDGVVEVGYSGVLFYSGYYSHEKDFDWAVYRSGYRRELTREIIVKSLKLLRSRNTPWLGDLLSQFSSAKEANSYLNKVFNLRGRVVDTIEGIEWKAFAKKAFRYIGGEFVPVLVKSDTPTFRYEGNLVVDDDGITRILLTQTICDEHPNEVFEVGGVCPICAQRFEIRSYTTNVLTILTKKETKKGLPLGVELEFDTNPRMVAKALKPLDGFAIAKQDGTIRGYEIVSLPATLPEHLSIFKSFLFDEQVTSDNTGMHVHIDSKSLSNLTVAKMYAFLYAPENIPFITTIAGRKFANNSYCRATEEDLLSRFTFSDEGVKREYSTSRYTALNNNSKYNTIECRIFASPKTWTEFAYRMQFIQAMVDYCANVSIQAVKKWDTFKEWVKNSHFKELKGVVC